MVDNVTEAPLRVVVEIKVIPPLEGATQDAVVPSLVKTVFAAPIAKGSKISLAPPSNKSPSSATNEVSIDDPSVRIAAAPSLTKSVSSGVVQP